MRGVMWFLVPALILPTATLAGKRLVVPKEFPSIQKAIDEADKFCKDTFAKYFK